MISRKSALAISCMSPDDILFSPIYSAPGWKQICREIIHWCARYHNNGGDLPVDRERPPGALLLEEMVGAFHDHNHRIFWRADYPSPPYSFEFDGAILEAGNGNTYPTFGVIVGKNRYNFSGLTRRSIKDANLVPNLYNHDYIFLTEEDAVAAFSFLNTQYP